MPGTRTDGLTQVELHCPDSRWYKRFIACVMTAAALGAVAGSLVPIYGTILGGLVGIITGLVVGLCHVKSVRKPLIAMFAYAALGGGVVAGAGSGLCLSVWGWMGPPSRDLFWTVVLAQFGVVTATFLSILWRLDRCARTVWLPPIAELACVTCGYDLRGLTSRTCPECGYINDIEPET